MNPFERYYLAIALLTLLLQATSILKELNQSTEVIPITITVAQVKT